MSRLDGKVAVITGGSSGIGLATAQRFVQEGAYVFITGRRQSELDKAKALIGDGVTTVAGDASKSADLDKLFATVLAEKGALDILVANSGRVEPEELGKITEENFDATFDLNARGTLFTVQKALPLMRDGGSVILVGSIAGYVGIPGYTTYSATKAALRSYTRTWTREFNDRGIRFNTLSPGPDRHPHHGRSGRLARGRRRDQGAVRRRDTTKPDGPPGGDRLRCFVFGLRRQQLRGRRRAERRRRHGAGLTQSATAGLAVARERTRDDSNDDLRPVRHVVALRRAHRDRRTTRLRPGLAVRHTARKPRRVDDACAGGRTHHHNRLGSGRARAHPAPPDGQRLGHSGADGTGARPGRGCVRHRVRRRPRAGRRSEPPGRICATTSARSAAY